MQRGNGHCHMESSFFLLEPAGGIQTAGRRALGSAQGAHYPAGTRGDIQAVTARLPVRRRPGVTNSSWVTHTARPAAGPGAAPSLVAPDSDEAMPVVQRRAPSWTSGASRWHFCQGWIRLVTVTPVRVSRPGQPQ